MLAKLEMTSTGRQETSSGNQSTSLNFLFCCFLACLNPKGSNCLFCLYGFAVGFLLCRFSAVFYVEKCLWDTLWSSLPLLLLHAMLQDFDPRVLCLSFCPSTKVNPSPALLSEICRSCSDVLKLSCLQLLSFKAGYCCSSQLDELPGLIPSYTVTKVHSLSFTCLVAPS